MTDRPNREDLRSYGRRRARAPSGRQQALWREVLPRVAVPEDAAALASPAALFAPPVREVWLEIGFGGGEHLVWQAKAHADMGLIGCEPFEDGVIKLIGAIEREGLANVRVCAEDARPLLRRLPEASLGRVFILFPDPWPKKRHHKRRIVSAATLAEVARVLRPGGELRIATDVGAYASVILDVAQRRPELRWTAQGPQDWRRRPPDWPQTRYEAKAVAAGRRCYFFRFERV
ncbi:MAG: tRNA (guanosine(46)-N7)-methyltransferase TrmB [Hyphomicrobiaceae bacterium]